MSKGIAEEAAKNGFKYRVVKTDVALHVLIGVTLALLLRDPLLKLRGVYRVILIVPWAVPNYITALIWKGMFQRQFGAINGLLAAVGLHPISWFSRFWTAFAANVATNVWLGFPFMMVVTLGALSRIPKELEEAAALDGATRWQRLRHVTLPLLKPALLPSVLLGAVWTFNMFNIVFLVSGGEPDGATDILVSQAYRWAFTRGHRYGYAAAYAVLIFAILAAQTFFAQREETAS
jgi:arabinogalactan oligomer/maltooligosaccharide transport system permease protein